MKNGGQVNNSIEKMLVLLSLYEDGSKELSPEEAQSLETARETETFLNMLPGGFFIYHADGNQQLIYANQALIRIFGCADLSEFRALTGNSFRGIVHPDDWARVDQSINEQISKSRENLDYVEYRIIRKDGAVRWVEDYGHFMHSKAVGDIYYVFVSDATEKIACRLNEKREKEEKLRNLINEHDRERTVFQQAELQRLKVIEGLSANYDTILYADMDKDEVLPYRLGTRTAYYFDEKLQVRSFTSIMKDYVLIWVYPEDRTTVAERTTSEYIRKKLAEEPSFHINYRCIENGKTKFLQLRIVNVGSTEHISQIVLGYRTVDEEILNELKQRSVLQSALHSAQMASVAKNTFLSNMSHDMRTPLNAIFGYKVLAEKCLEKPDRIREYLGKIETAGKQILDLINNVLELSYMESQDFRLSETECNLCSIVQGVYRSLLPQANEKKITLSLIVNAEHCDVYSDREKLEQAVRHLVDNAVKYTKEGGRVEISVAELPKENLAQEYAAYRITVTDTGIGISEEALPHIFDPFERENNTTQAGVYGLGLGLTIAKQIVGCMGGSIKAESEAGKGSTFTIALDLKMKNACGDGSAKPKPLDLNGKKILIVEDNLINLEIEVELLSELGCEVDTAPNGKIAVEKVAASAPKEYLFVLMDIQMPVMDGRAAAQVIRALPDSGLSEIPIIALSANAFESDVKASLDAGMNAHLTKPIDIPLLLSTLEGIV